MLAAHWLHQAYSIVEAAETYVGTGSMQLATLAA